MLKRKWLCVIFALLFAFPFMISAAGCSESEEEEIYTITYTDIGDSTFERTNPSTYKSTDNDIVLFNPTREGDVFIGWTGTGLTEPTMNVTIKKGSSGNRTYKANWQDVYNIIYTNIDGATFERTNPSTYKNSDDIVLSNPTKEGFVFIGWTGTGLTEPTMNVTIKKGSSGNRMYQANWKEEKDESVTYTITYIFKCGRENIDASFISNFDDLPKNYDSGFSKDIAISVPIHQNNRYVFAGWTGSGLEEKVSSLTVTVGTKGDLNFTADFDYWTGYY